VTFQSNAEMAGKGFKLRYSFEGILVWFLTCYHYVISHFNFCNGKNLFNLSCNCPTKCVSSHFLFYPSFIQFNHILQVLHALDAWESDAAFCERHE
jgi:hypothetical protein